MPDLDSELRHVEYLVKTLNVKGGMSDYQRKLLVEVMMRLEVLERQRVEKQKLTEQDDIELAEGLAYVKRSLGYEGEL